ncbi:PQQ-binding-like beta-propeller repeat protein [Streptomyces sp. NPDC020192]|uniref:outer membrane protein assembly factor BamB family protein n=1 Tax=Streptomyces sp. NPDC020192 TaxID=3365066 RepID=UPI00379BF845
MSSKRAIQIPARWACAAVVVISTLTGCGSHGGHETPVKAPTAQPKSASRPIHDPPASFATRHSVPLPDDAIAGRLTVSGTLNSPLPVALYKTTAFIATARHMQVMDTVTGTVTALIIPDNTPVESADAWASTNHAAAPLLTTSQGTPSVLAPFVVTQTGTGTQASHTVVEVTATNADTGQVMWRLTLQPPQWDTGSDLRATAIGSAHGIAVIRISTGDDDYAAAYGIDLNRPRQAWMVDKFQASAVTDQTVAGAVLEDEVSVDQRPAGFDLTTGKRLWQGSNGTWVGADPAGPHLLRIHGKDYDSGHSYDRLVDPLTGRTLHTLPADLGDSDCTYDDRSVLVCSGMGSESRVAYGVDTSSGKVLWQLPDKQADRIAPKITTAWHGRVYGETDHGAIALDARTGKDVPSPGAAPLLVNESTGIVLDSGLVAYPTSS